MVVSNGFDKKSTLFISLLTFLIPCKRRKIPKVFLFACFVFIPFVVTLSLWSLSRTSRRYGLNRQKNIYKSRLKENVVKLPPYEDELPETQKEQNSGDVSPSQATFSKTNNPTPTENASNQQHHNQYIAYLPHSGMGNQLVELENALVLSYILNRTLVLPPVYLGCAEEVTWKPFNYLRRLLIRVDEKVGGVVLPNKTLDRRLERHIQKALAFHSQKTKAILEWSDLIDLESLRKLGIRFEYASNIVKSISPQDITTFAENTRYEYMYSESIPRHENPLKAVDNHENIFNRSSERTDKKQSFRYMVYSSPEKPSTIVSSDNELPLLGSSGAVNVFLDKYNHVVNLNATITEFQRPLLLFGSLFGQYRLSLHSNATLLARHEIWKRLVYTNPTLSHLSDKIVKRFFPRNEHFIGVHVRMGEGTFKERVNETIARISSIISENLRSHNIDSIKLYVATDAPTDSIHSVVYEPFRSIQGVSGVVSMFDVLTDPIVKNSLHQLFSTKSPVRSTLVPLLSLYDPEVGEEDVSQKPFLFQHQYASKEIEERQWSLAVPMLDQMIAMRGRYVIGTNGSTFSKIIERLHFVHCENNNIPNGFWGMY